MSDQEPIFHGQHGSVWRQGENYGWSAAVSTLHLLCVDMAQEIERLLVENAAFRRTDTALRRKVGLLHDATIVLFDGIGIADYRDEANEKATRLIEEAAAI